MLVISVQLLYDVIHQVDHEKGQNRQIQANSDCQGHNGTDALYAYKFAFQLRFKSCIYGIKPAVRGVNKIQSFCYLHTQGHHKLHKRPRRFPLFSF